MSAARGLSFRTFYPVRPPSLSLSSVTGGAKVSKALEKTLLPLKTRKLWRDEGTPFVHFTVDRLHSNSPVNPGKSVRSGT